MEVSLTAETITLVVAGIFSLVFSYFPYVAKWYNAQTPDMKRIIMLVMLLAVSLGSFALGCAGILAIDLTCDKIGVIGLVRLFILSLIANQAVDRISPKIGLKSDSLG